MIKVFLNGNKLNVVDDKNNLVGFDTDDDCCAHGGWFVSPEKISKNLEKHDQLETDDKEYPEYLFDTDFFEHEQESSEVDDGGLVRFKMVAEGKPDLFLHLYNSHNGYYSKGFSASFRELPEDEQYL